MVSAHCLHFEELMVIIDLHRSSNAQRSTIQKFIPYFQNALVQCLAEKTDGIISLQTQVAL